ncbi:MAG TPA: class III poly(R)-hydroxyalkanoic acid synthase subunit PhaC [Phycisphaerae bacterium]|mgnify:CR=1 FL=1|nr:class III poly(R)-hydroxyalkanoic acid synthase subunit PhaC [Phycisphaerae bacterium]
MSTMTSNPWGLTPEQLVANWESFVRKAWSLPKVAEVAQRVQVGCTPAQIVSRDDSIRLLRYETADDRRYATPLLFVFALVNRPYILDLRPEKSVVGHFLRRGFDTYNIDWGVPADGDRYLGLKDYVLRYLDHAVDHIRERTGQERVNLLGYCMGGTMTAMYTALRPEKVKNLILLTAPVDWSVKDNLLSLWADERYFNIDRMIEVYGNAPAQWLQASFLMLKPVQNMMEKYVTFYENMDNEKWLEDFFAMETWLNDNIPVAGEVFREFVKYMFQKNQLIRGELEVAGERVDLKKIACPVLNLIAQNDHLVPPNQSLTFNDVVSSADRRLITFPAGHIGMAVGGKAHRDLWPTVCDWLAERSQETKAAT